MVMKNSARKSLGRIVDDDEPHTTWAPRTFATGRREKGGGGDGEEWRDPSIAAWEEAAAAVSAVSSEPGARPRAQHAEPWTESLAPSLRDAIDALDWSQTHAALMPNAWNRRRLATFAETWAVFGVGPRRIRKRRRELGRGGSCWRRTATAASIAR